MKQQTISRTNMQQSKLNGNNPAIFACINMLSEKMLWPKGRLAGRGRTSGS